MHKKHNPETIAGPFGRYSHAVEVAPGVRWLHVSGQVGVKPDGSTAEGIEAQARTALENVRALLAGAGMATGDLVKMTVFVTDFRYADAYRAARDAVLGEDARVASTLLAVTALAKPEWLIEVEAVAAKA